LAHNIRVASGNETAGLKKLVNTIPGEFNQVLESLSVEFRRRA